MAHRRRLLYFAQRLRDKVELPVPSKMLQAIVGGEQPTPWRGERVEGGLPYTRDEEEAEVSAAWGSFYHYVEPRKQPFFGELESHLAGERCWEALEGLEAAFDAYLTACRLANEATERALRARLPGLPSEDRRMMVESLVMGIYQKRLDGRGYDFTYRIAPASGAALVAWSLELAPHWRLGPFNDEGTPALVAEVHKQIAAELVHASPLLELEKARASLNREISAFTESLGSDLQLQERIRQGRCAACS